MMHSSSAVDPPPLKSARLVLPQGRTSPSPVEVSMTPLPLRSTHAPASSRPTRTIEPPLVISSRLPTQTLPSRSTVVRDGLPLRVLGQLRYSPRILPSIVSILMIVSRPEAATQMNGNVEG